MSSLPQPAFLEWSSNIKYYNLIYYNIKYWVCAAWRWEFISISIDTSVADQILLEHKDLQSKNLIEKSLKKKPKTSLINIKTKHSAENFAWRENQSMRPENKKL